VSRAVLAVMAGLLCTLAGIRHAATLRKDALRLNRWVKLLQHLTLLLREGTLTVPQALHAAADMNMPPDKLLRDIASCVTASPMLSLAQAYQQSSTDTLEHAALARMFERIGRGSKDSRILALEQCTDEIRLLADSAAAKADKDVRLWQTLGLIGGICLTILLL